MNKFLMHSSARSSAGYKVTNKHTKMNNDSKEKKLQ